MKASEIPAVTIAPAEEFHRLPPSLVGFDKFDRAMRLNCPVYALASTHAEAMGLSPADAVRWTGYQLALRVAALEEQAIRNLDPQIIVVSDSEHEGIAAKIRDLAGVDRIFLKIVQPSVIRALSPAGDVGHGSEVRRE